MEIEYHKVEALSRKIFAETKIFYEVVKVAILGDFLVGLRALFL